MISEELKQALAVAGIPATAEISRFCDWPSSDDEWPGCGGGDWRLVEVASDEAVAISRLVQDLGLTPQAAIERWQADTAAKAVSEAAEYAAEVQVDKEWVLANWRGMSCWDNTPTSPVGWRVIRPEAEALLRRCLNARETARQKRRQLEIAADREANRPLIKAEKRELRRQECAAAAAPVSVPVVPIGSNLGDMFSKLGL